MTKLEQIEQRIQEDLKIGVNTVICAAFAMGITPIIVHMKINEHSPKNADYYEVQCGQTVERVFLALGGPVKS